MRRLLPLLLAVSLLAGCASEEPVAPAGTDAAVPPEEPMADPTAAPRSPVDQRLLEGNTSGEPETAGPNPGAPRFGPSAPLPQDGFGAEPNIAVAPDGTLFVAAPAGATADPNLLQGGAWLWRSNDGGATWETLRRPATQASTPAPLGYGSGDADVVVSPDGVVYFTDWWIVFDLVTGSLLANNFLVERSLDGGDTWEAAPLTTLDPFRARVDRQWLVAGKGGLVGLVYTAVPYNSLHALGSSITLTPYAEGIQGVFSTDGGRTWGLPVAIAGPTEGTDYQLGHPFLLSDGAVAVPYAPVLNDPNFFEGPAEVRLAVSRDGGTTWDSSLVAPVPFGFMNIWAVQGAADAVGNVYVAWAARSTDGIGVSVAHSSTGGATWTEPIPITTSGIHVTPWVAARGTGQVAVAWYGTNATGFPMNQPAETEWYAYVAESPASGAPLVPTRASVTPVKRGNLCPYGGGCPGERDLLDFLTLAYGPDGTLHLAFARANDEVGPKGVRIHHAKAPPA